MAGNQGAFDDWKQFLIRNNRSFSVLEKNYSKAIINPDGSVFYKYRSRIEVQEDISDRDIKNICTAVTKCFNNYILANDFQVPRVVRMNTQRQKFRDHYKRMLEGSPFFIFDLDHAYWFFAKYLGIITDKVFDKYCPDEFKVVRNIAMARVRSCYSKTYFMDRNGEKFEWTIKEVKDQHRIAYMNIVNTCANYTSSAGIGMNELCLAYTVDSVTVNLEGYEVMKELLTTIPDMTIKAERCVKIDDRFYRNAMGEIKEF